MTFNVLSAAYLVRLAICILPVLTFLGGLVLLDSFKLAPIRRLVVALGAGKPDLGGRLRKISDPPALIRRSVAVGIKAFPLLRRSDGQRLRRQFEARRIHLAHGAVVDFRDPGSRASSRS